MIIRICVFIVSVESHPKFTQRGRKKVANQFVAFGADGPGLTGPEVNVWELGENGVPVQMRMVLEPPQYLLWRRSG